MKPSDLAGAYTKIAKMVLLGTLIGRVLGAKKCQIKVSHEPHGLVFIFDVWQLFCLRDPINRMLKSGPIHSSTNFKAQFDRFSLIL